MCRKYGTQIPPNPVRTPAGKVHSDSFQWSIAYTIFILRATSHLPIFPSAFLILICIKKHPRANDSIQSGSVSPERTHNAGESSPGGTRRDGSAGSANITQPVQRQLFLSLLLSSGHFHVGTCAIWHRVTASPPFASSPCPATSKVEAASERRAGLARQMGC